MFTMIAENWIYELPFAGLLLLCSWLLWEYFVTPKNLPPGPWGIPILGYLPFLGAKPHVTLTNLSKKYGDVFKFSVGKHTIIVLTSYNVLKEAFVKQSDAFSGRPKQLNTVLKDIPGIISNDGESWVEFRRFSLTTLKDFGFGRSTLEPQLMEEIQRFLEVIKSADGKPIEIGELLHLSVTNVICTLITGRRMEYDNPTLNELLELTKQQINSIGFGKVENFLPPILRKPGLTKLIGIKSPIEPLKRMLKILSDIVERHVKVLRSDSRDNFIDCWLTELEKQGQKTTLLTKKQLPSVLRDLFMAGSDTTANSLTWALLYMVQYPKVQEKVQHEIDEIIGRERISTMSDQKSMPYTDATLMELTRLATLVPLSLLHRCTKDSTLNGYFIPKDAVIVPNLWAVHHDPETFPDPDEFKPERFLQDDKLQIKKMEELIPFSLGKRQCMGESLARMELFLYFTSILQHFTLKKVDGIPLDFDYNFALISIPKPQELCLIPR